MSATSIHESRPSSGRQRRRSLRRACAGALCAASLATVGGSIAEATTPPEDTATDAAESTGAAESSAPAGDDASTVTPVPITLTESSLDGLPEDLAAGVVDVTVTDETEGSGGDVSFTLVEPGTDVETFKTDLISTIFTGGPIPEYFLNNAGVIGQGMITLDEGEYIVWSDLASNLDRETTADDIVTAALAVGPGDDDAVIPETDGAILSGDYLFGVDVSAGGSTVTFTNSSDNQLHHVIVVDFGTNDPTVVEENLPTLLASEEEDAMPEGIDPTQINFEFASSGVFGPGGSGTFDATFETGRTYAALCFISDREGGLPHAIQHDMYEVFQVDEA